MLFQRRTQGYFPVPEIAVQVDKTLPVGTYTLLFDPDEGFYFQPIDDFILPPKLYGDVEEKTERVLSTFLSRPGATGLLLAGEKGAGKTLLAKNIAIQAAKRHGMPTIIVGAPFSGEGFNALIQGIKQDAILFFDEFEKIYRERGEDRKPQEGLLTLLDGTYPTRKLFMLTTNDLYAIDRHLKNRPGRLFYLLKYKGLDKQFVREYCEDNLKNQDHLDGVLAASALFEHFNFDLLKALVEEMNRYNEDAKSALQFLNAIPEGSGVQMYQGELYVNGNEVPEENTSKIEFYIDPLGIDNDSEDSELIVNIFPFGTEVYNASRSKALRDAYTEREGRTVPPAEECRKIVTFERSDLKRVDHFEGAFVYETEIGKDKYTLILQRRRKYSYDYYSAL